MIRYMQECDLEQVCRIEEEVFSNPWSRESFSRALADVNNVYSVVISEDGKVSGYCGIWGVGTEGQVCNIAILPEARNHGVGSTLLDFTIDACRRKGIKDFTLEVRESNLVARRLYEKKGFVYEGTRKGYYSNPVEDALIMWLYEG